MTEVEKARQVLRDNGYFVDNLWHVDDVKERYNCTDDEQAQEILYNALTKEVKSLRHEVGVLTSELDELRYLMKTEQVGALVIKNKKNIEKNIILEAKNKRLKEEYDRMFVELIKIKNR